MIYHKLDKGCPAYDVGIGLCFMKNVVIKGTGVYIPANEVDNEQLDDHFEKRGLSAHSLMEHLGRKKKIFYFRR